MVTMHTAWAAAVQGWVRMRSTSNAHHKAVAAACRNVLTCVCHHCHHIASEQPQLLDACTAQPPSSWSDSRDLLGIEVAEWQTSPGPQPGDLSIRGMQALRVVPGKSHLTNARQVDIAMASPAALPRVVYSRERLVTSERLDSAPQSGLLTSRLFKFTSENGMPAGHQHPALVA